MVAGDADFVPAAKLARREGVQFISIRSGKTSREICLNTSTVCEAASTNRAATPDQAMILTAAVQCSESQPWHGDLDGSKMSALGENGTPEQKLLLGGIPRW